MLLKELLKKHEDKLIVQRLCQLYPDQKKNKKGYYKALQELRGTRRIATKYQLVIKTFKDYGSYSVVWGINKKKELRCLEYDRWGQWLSMPIDDRCYKKYRKLDILAHCLYELTWAGFSDKEVQQSKQAIIEAFKKVGK